MPAKLQVMFLLNLKDRGKPSRYYETTRLLNYWVFTLYKADRKGTDSCDYSNKKIKEVNEEVPN